MDLFRDIPEEPPLRVLIWFSCGVTSAVAAKLALLTHPDALVVRIRIGSEHEDADRFANDVSKWIDRPIINLDPEPYQDHFEVIDAAQFIVGRDGAPCSLRLKVDTRVKFQRPGDLHIFGFDTSEEDRIERFRDSFPDLRFESPLAEANLSKQDCHGILKMAGIRPHRMYELGFANGNCVGCVKGGIRYWNRIRVHFPAVFSLMAIKERMVNHAILRHRSGPLKGQPWFLDELDPTAGGTEKDEPIECGPFCQAALNHIGAA